MLASERGLTARSYYAASAPPLEPQSPLESAVTVDVCVVGAGFAGLSAALDLRARGYSVVVLEAERVGWGASGRNGGQAIVGHASEDALQRQLGRDGSRQAWDITVEGLNLVRSRITDHAIDCDFRAGFLLAAVNARKGRALRQWFDEGRERYAYPHWQWIEPEHMRDAIASPLYHSGLLDTFSGHLHPLKYCLGLARAALASGVVIHEGSRVTAITPGQPATVTTARGEVRARYVVLAGNAYLGQLEPTIAPRIMPVGTYIIATEPLREDLANSLIPGRPAVCDTNFVLDYFRLSADNRMLFGGRVSYSTLTPPNLERVMAERMRHVFPQLGPDVAVDYTWGGFVDITANRAPDFGRIGPNVYYLQGFSGHGVVLTGMAGRLVAEAIAGQAERFDLYARLRHIPFPGGRWMRTPALVLGMLYYRLRDLI